MADMALASVLLVTADLDEGRRIEGFLRERHFSVQWVEDAREAFNRLGENRFDGVVTETQPAHGESLRLLQLALERNRECACIFLADPDDIQLATAGVCAGAYDFQTRPVNLEKLEATLERGLAHQRLVLENTQLRQRLDQRYGLSNLVGQSRAMARIYSAIREFARSQAPLLIHGEPGTGKDFVAQAIHHSSERRDAPFLKVRCDALDEEFFEADFLGVGNTQARFAYPAGGTLYLEGVEHIPLRHQVALAGHIQSGQMDTVRIMVATDGAVEVVQAAGGLAPELLALLGSNVLALSPLRERAEDIDLLLERALGEAMEAQGKHMAGISVALRRKLDGYPWPGNVRELFMLVNGMVLNAEEGSLLEVESLPGPMRAMVEMDGGGLQFPVGTPLHSMERRAIEAMMVACGRNKEECAKTLGMGLRTLYRKLKEYEEG